jgi:hypothetical protein
VQENEVDCGKVLERIHYHGVAGLLADMRGWPALVESSIRHEALGRAMWELRHRQLLAPLLDQLAEKGLRALLLKGTALAYAVYDEPAHRTRGDSDLWVHQADLESVRLVLEAAGFKRDEAGGQVDAMQLEEGWICQAGDGSSHVVDLHWSAINSAALRSLFDFDHCWERRSALPRLSPGAAGLGLADALLHTAVHRQMHVASPYIVDGATYYGGDRLIWAKDVALLVEALGPAGLKEAAGRALELGIADPLRSSLLLARDRLGAAVEPALLDALGSAAPSPAGRYLAHGQVGRALRDIAKVRGFKQKVATVADRLLPSRDFLEAKYGKAGRSGTFLLILRRFGGFLLPRRGGGLR